MNDHNAAGPTLYIFAGLPGSGKTTLSQLFARHVNAAYLRIDTIEQALRDLCAVDVQGEGYDLAYRIATDNLQLGINVVADSCNPIELTRNAWEEVASESNAACVNIEVICSAEQEHQRRVESRVPTVAGLELPTWEEIKNREYHHWTRKRIVIDTAGKSETECFDELLSKLFF